jgi:mono/diheme cytochrome c family protein
MKRRAWWTVAAIGATLALGAGTALAGDAPWTAPAADKAKKNPVAKAAAVRDGKKSFETNCVACHGPQGKGDGPAAAALSPKPRNLADKVVQDETDGEIFWKLTTGRGSMPPWQQLPEKERWSLVHFIRSLASKK